MLYEIIGKAAMLERLKEIDERRRAADEPIDT